MASISCCARVLLMPLIPLALLVALPLYMRLSEADPASLASEGSLGPFCSTENETVKCKSKRWLCGCSSGSCERGGDIDWEVLRGLNFTEGVVRMATFRNELKVPKRLPWLIRSPAIWLLGGAVEMREGEAEGEASARVFVPSHAWSEIELPHSNCYLMLGGQTSTFRDRAIHGFRLVLHDTTFRFWEREKGKFAYSALLLHQRRPLSDAHVQLLSHLIEHGDRRQVERTGGLQPSGRQGFERDTDQDLDLSPIFLELPPARFVFRDDAAASMLSAYLGLFGLHSGIASAFAKPAFNCVVMALLVGRSPGDLPPLPRAHEDTRAQARDVEDFWQHQLAGILEEAEGLFKAAVDAPRRPPPPWWQRWLPRPLLPPPAPEKVTLGFQEQIARFRPDYLTQVMLPLKKALVQHDPLLEQRWAETLALSDTLLGYQLEEFVELRRQTAGGCEAKHAIDQLLFCPDWQQTKYWRDLKRRGRSQAPSAATLVKETNIAVRRLLYWHAAERVSGESEVPHDPLLVQSCMSRGGVKGCFARGGD